MNKGKMISGVVFYRSEHCSEQFEESVSFDTVTEMFQCMQSLHTSDCDCCAPVFKSWDSGKEQKFYLVPCWIG